MHNFIVFRVVVKFIVQQYASIKRIIPLGEAQLRIPPHWRPPPPIDDDSSSLGKSDIPLTIPDNANVNYAVLDGTSIATRKTQNWTPIASRTRAPTKTSFI